MNKYSSLEELLGHFDGDMYRVDLGCGFSKPTGYIGIDNFVGRDAQIQDLENGPDIIMDLNVEPLPFPDCTCKETRASHFLEHCNIPHILNECHRILHKGGIFHITVPYANSAEGMYPGHNIFLTEKWFNENIQFNSQFKIESIEYFASKDWLSLPSIVRLFIPFKFARTFFLMHVGRWL